MRPWHASRWCWSPRSRSAPRHRRQGQRRTDAARSRPPRSFEALTVEGIGDHLEELQAIADDNGGNRASGFPGYDASADYVAETLDDAGWEVSTQEFDFDVFFQDAPTVFEQISPTPETYDEATDYATTEFSGSGEVTAELVAVDLKLPPDAEPSLASGCEASDFAGTGVAGKIALMQRGTCDFRVKVDNAAAAGAVGASSSTRVSRVAPT